ncbi:MAG: DUF1566 domain-containing protein [Gammaproteobacteria bacterium]|nr:DUF1566 domain-containing protein [Gammaproteobacteria bacterium]
MKLRNFTTLIACCVLLPLSACFHNPATGPSDKSNPTANPSTAGLPILTITSLSNPDLNVPESRPTISFRAKLSQIATEDIPFRFRITDGTATRQNDFFINNTGRDTGASVETIPEGSDFADFSVNIQNDDIDEINEQFTVDFQLPEFADGRGPQVVLDAPPLKIIIIDDDDAPVVQIAPETGNLITVRESVGVVKLTLTMPLKLASQDVEIPILVTYPSVGFATPGSDFEVPQTIIYPAQNGGTSRTFEYNLYIKDDALKEENETFFVSLLDPLNHIAFLGSTGLSSVTITILDDDAIGGINDTQVTTCANYTNYNVGCSTTTDFPGQDGESNTPMNMQFVDEAGFPTQDPNLAACVKDLNTGLMWEVKASAPDASQRSAKFLYSWYNPLINANGGQMGFEGNSSSCGGSLDTCNTSAYIEFLNKNDRYYGNGLCGSTDWRLPKIHELVSIMRFSPLTDLSKDAVMFDESIFLGKQPGYYWTSNPKANFSLEAWAVFMGKTPDSYGKGRMFVVGLFKDKTAFIRAVTHY